tara:strand:+ start:2504 stop:2752 length:249 start_codon:yes stop_codon:yes gene_type:complete
MKNLFAVIVALGFISNAWADDWRMRKFDFNMDGYVSKLELKEAGCRINNSLFLYADKDDNDLLDQKELRRASEYIVKKRCPK